MINMQKPIIIVTMGDPSGIGPEVIAKALSKGHIQHHCHPIVLGNTEALKEAIAVSNMDVEVCQISDIENYNNSDKVISIIDPHNISFKDIKPGNLSASCGKASMEWVEMAANLIMSGKANALATAPINKEAAKYGGYKSIGHMELLQELSSSENVATMLITGSLNVVHLTTHHSLKIACDYVTKKRVLSMIQLTHDSFQKWGIANPRIGVAALNPHAGDGGLLGREENEAISPAIEQAQLMGINTSGPIPADIIFHQTIEGKYDVVLAMYHDQGHIAIKVHGFEESISVNLGLPFVRTSVDHGTAFDIAGKGVANHTSMAKAINLAANMCRGTFSFGNKDLS